jgi:hypothetical protein
LILAVAVLVVAGALLLLSVRNAPPVPAVTINFTGFTNSAGQMEALFALKDPLPDAAVSLHLVEPTTGEGSLPVGNFSWARRESWGLSYAIAVDTTNEPLRVVFQFQRRAGGPRRLIELVRELFARLRGRDLELFTGGKFWVTNETRVVDRAQ